MELEVLSTGKSPMRFTTALILCLHAEKAHIAQLMGILATCITHAVVWNPEPDADDLDFPETNANQFVCVKAAPAGSLLDLASADQ